MDLTMIQTIGTILAAALAAIGGKELIHFIIKKYMTSKEQHAIARQEAASQLQSHELKTAGSLIEQLQKQNERTTEWMMNNASSDLRSIANTVSNVEGRIAEIYTYVDVVSRQLQGLTDEVVAINASLDFKIKDMLEDFSRHLLNQPEEIQKSTSVQIHEIKESESENNKN